MLPTGTFKCNILILEVTFCMWQYALGILVHHRVCQTLLEVLDSADKGAS